MTEIASHGYFVVADGMPGGGASQAAVWLASILLAWLKRVMKRRPALLGKDCPYCRNSTWDVKSANIR
jgi:serine/threonine protein phosphatase PrpC